MLADSEGDLRLSDFGIAIAQEVLAAEQANADSTVGRVNPSGGFHKRHMVSACLTLILEVQQHFESSIELSATMLLAIWTEACGVTDQQCSTVHDAMDNRSQPHCII